MTTRGANVQEVRFVLDHAWGSDLVEADDAKFYDEKFFKPLAENLGLPALPAT